jgi:hypothetical protein
MAVRRAGILLDPANRETRTAERGQPAVALRTVTVIVRTRMSALFGFLTRSRIHRVIPGARPSTLPRTMNRGDSRLVSRDLVDDPLKSAA